MPEEDLTPRLAARLRSLRQDRDWTLDRLAEASGVSRATLSRLENAEVSPTTEVLGRLCSAFGMTLSRLLAEVETGFQPVVREGERSLWHDAAAGFERRVVSPPAGALQGEVIECRLAPGAAIDYEAPPVPGLEHHLVMLDGTLEVTVDGAAHRLAAGDCLRYRLSGASAFRADGAHGASYLLFLV